MCDLIKRSSKRTNANYSAQICHFAVMKLKTSLHQLENSIYYLWWFKQNLLSSGFKYLVANMLAWKKQPGRFKKRSTIHLSYNWYWFLIFLIITLQWKPRLSTCVVQVFQRRNLSSKRSIIFESTKCKCKNANMNIIFEKVSMFAITYEFFLVTLSYH